MFKSRQPSEFPEELSRAGFSLFHLEKFLLGELSTKEQAEIKLAAKTHPKLATYLQRAEVWTKQSRSLKLPKRLSPERSAWQHFITECKAQWKRFSGSEGMPAWRLRGLSLASVIVLVGILSLTTLQKQREATQNSLSPKGGSGADMLLELKTKQFPAGSDLAVNPGDTVRIFYRSTDSIFFQLWSQGINGERIRIHQGLGEAMPPSAKWLHSGKSLVIDSGKSPLQLALIWSHSRHELTELEKKWIGGKNIPEENTAHFHLHAPPHP